MPQLLKLLGSLGTKLPTLTEKEWGSIFEFLDYYTVIEGGSSYTSFDWKKVKEILSLLGKIKY